jgi:stearoyl-CoA desaturase (delta-9 desaturase)
MARAHLKDDAKAPRTDTPTQSSPLVIDWGIVSWFVIMHAAALILPFYFTNWGAVAVGFALYVVTAMFGITLGYHRLLTHRSFKAPRWVERALATVGLLAVQRSPLHWVAHHRMHHAFSDHGGDPHNSRKGFFWSHIGWMCQRDERLTDMATLRKWARDIHRDPYMNALTPMWVQIGVQALLGVLLLALGGWAYVTWGIFVRLVVVYHVTWFVNSATHRWGYRNYESSDTSRNTWWVGILAFGEGWHNNHHANPDVAPAGHKWWEFDMTWLTIRCMERLGLAYDVKRPAAWAARDVAEAPTVLASNMASAPRAAALEP